MANKHDVIGLNRKHPDWTAKQIAAAIRACEGYVNATARRNGLTLAKVPRQKRPKVESLRSLGLAAREAGLTIASIRSLTLSSQQRGSEC